MAYTFARETVHDDIDTIIIDIKYSLILDCVIHKIIVWNHKELLGCPQEFDFGYPGQVQNPLENWVDRHRSACVSKAMDAANQIPIPRVRVPPRLALVRMEWRQHRVVLQKKYGSCRKLWPKLFARSIVVSTLESLRDLSLCLLPYVPYDQIQDREAVSRDDVGSQVMCWHQSKVEGANWTEVFFQPNNGPSPTTTLRKKYLRSRGF